MYSFQMLGDHYTSPLGPPSRSTIRLYPGRPHWRLHRRWCFANHLRRYCFRRLGDWNRYFPWLGCLGPRFCPNLGHRSRLGLRYFLCHRLLPCLPLAIVWGPCADTWIMSSTSFTRVEEEKHLAVVGKKTSMPILRSSLIRHQRRPRRKYESSRLVPYTRVVRTNYTFTGRA